MARPRQFDEAKTEKLNLRVTPSFKRTLEERARKASRSLTQEAEVRLIESFAFDYASTITRLDVA